MNLGANVHWLNMDTSSTIEGLQKRIAELESENQQLRRDFSNLPNGNSVIVPAELEPLFNLAQQTVGAYFTNLKMDPATGTIEINDQRYLLVRASALSKDFLDTIHNLYADRGEAEAMSIGRNFLFDISHALGMNDAKNFHQKMNLTDPIAKLSAGPVHFAYTGWAFVEILPESHPSPDDDFYLIYNHPFSFEADSWIRSGKKSSKPVCIMNTGYSSGWCEESFRIPLTAVEVTCTAKGDSHCTFIMSPPHKIEEHLNQFHSRSNDYDKIVQYEVPTFFDRKRVEEELHRSRRLAEESVQLKTDFVANMSHELRTPLGTILGFAELLSKTSLTAAQKEYVESINSSGNSLLSIINDILDLSKLDAGKFTVEHVPFSIPELLHSVQNMFAGKAKKKSLKLYVTVDAALNYTVYGDPMRLTQVLVNLIGNAVKFTEAGSISLRCNVAQENSSNAEVSFHLKDTGIGIPADKLPHIFERFTQADPAITRRYGGTGLGLAITRQLIELLGGNIGVKSKEGEGSEFYFTLPFAKASNDTAREKKEQQQMQLLQFDGAKTILVVEDNPMNQKLTTIILKNNGLEFELAENGSDAVKILRNKKVDLILMDIQMPVMDGYQATCIIRDELHIHTPIIAMTAHALSGEKEKCIEQGINDYLPKPFTEAELLVKIGYWIKEVKQTPHTNGKEKLTNLEFLRKQTRNNEAAIKEMISLFIDQNPKDIAALETAIAQEDYNAIYKKVHALRNSIGFFDLTIHIGDVLLNMESMAKKEQEIEEIKTAFEKVKTVCAKAVSELSTITV